MSVIRIYNEPQRVSIMRRDRARICDTETPEIGVGSNTAEGRCGGVFGRAGQRNKGNIQPGV